jgi:hypothetical protein
VLDDSRVLCMSDGERIKLHDRIKIIIETDDVS